MIKISICGKANSGKNLFSNILCDALISKISNPKIEILAFADPVKKIAKQMFPKLSNKYLFGSSKYRSNIVPGAFKNGEPLTIRQLLVDIGTGFGRSYNENIWLDVFDHKFQEYQDRDMVIVTDNRFCNEFFHLKQLGFYQIKLLRNQSLKINHASETEQETIKDSEFNLIVQNNGSIDDLRKTALYIINELLI